jgi:PhnB protein
MSLRFNPYLSFDGNAKEALEFYKGIFGGKLDISTFGEFPNPPEGYADKVMHGVLEADDLTLMASETMPGTERQVGNAASLSMSGDDDEKLTKYFEALGEGGKVVMPLEKQMWGDKFGMVTDKYGFLWMVNISAPKDAAKED